MLICTVGLCRSVCGCVFAGVSQSTHPLMSESAALPLIAGTARRNLPDLRSISANISLQLTTFCLTGGMCGSREVKGD